MTDSPLDKVPAASPAWLAAPEGADRSSPSASVLPPIVKSVTVLHANSDEYTFHYESTGDRFKAWARQGALWGGFWSAVFGGLLAVRAWKKHLRAAPASNPPKSKS